MTGVQVYGNGHAGLNGYPNTTAGTITTTNLVTGAAVSTPPRGAFAQVPKTETRFGNSGYGAIVGPGLAQTDAPLSKFFPIAESVRMKSQWNVFNVQNRINFNGINLNANNSNFGTFSSAFPPRQMQFGLKALF